MKVLIETDLTTVGTTVTIDGVKLSDDKKIASISFYADAPNKRYESDGYVSFNVTSFDNDGVVKSERYCVNKEMSTNVKPLGLQDNVVYNLSDFTRFLGSEVDVEKKHLIDSIIDHCSKNKVTCPSVDALLNRTVQSLQDKVADLGISSESAQT
jgi:hypothetical protein